MAHPFVLTFASPPGHYYEIYIQISVVEPDKTVSLYYYYELYYKPTVEP